MAAAAAVLVLLGTGTGYFLGRQDTSHIVAVNQTIPKLVAIRDSDISSAPPVAVSEPVHTATNPQGAHASQPHVAQLVKPVTVAASEMAVNEAVPVMQGTGIPEDGNMAHVIVKGKITDETGEGFPGAEIRFKGSAIYAITDLDGNYTLEMTDVKPVMEVSAAGYDKKEIPVAGSNAGNVQLSPNNGPQVTWSYNQSATNEKFKGTGDVITTRKMEKLSATDMASAIDGSVLGVQPGNGQAGAVTNVVVKNDNPLSYGSSQVNNYAVNAYGMGFNENQQTNVKSYKRPLESASKPLGATANGQPGAASNITLRKAATAPVVAKAPLVVVDGIFYDGDITSLKPEEVLSIKLLKDTAAIPLYGSRAANGAIIVQTKHGLPKKKRGILQWFKK